MPLAPIVLFVYNRPIHTRRVVEALRKNFLAGESDLIVYSDGCKQTEDFAKVQGVRDYIRAISGFKSVTLVEREENLGLSGSIIAGVTELVNRFGKVIVLEDDILTASFFLQYMNDALELYKDEDRVISVVGYTHPAGRSFPETFFIKSADCWGWGTWKRGWDLFEQDGVALLGRLRDAAQLQEFDYNGTFPFVKMLEDQIAGRNNSWAIRWYASAFLANKLSLYPGRSLVQNIGMDGTGINSGVDSSHVNPDLAQGQVCVTRQPISENGKVRKALEQVFRRKRSIWARVSARLKRTFKEMAGR